MKTPARRQPTHHARQHAGGFALLEILIAMVVIALWLLAHAGLQLNALKFQQSAQSRLTALSLASDLVERMEANVRGARNGDYALAARSTATTSTLNCVTASCTSTQLATYDLVQWTGRAATALIVESMQVENTTAAGGLTTYSITMSWKEAAGNRRYATTEGQTGNSAPSQEVLTLVTTKVVRN